MPPISVMIKPVSGACNLRCRYCFYADVMNHREEKLHPRMTLDTLERVVRRVMAYADGVWSNDAFGDRGWMAIALVIFALWKPHMAIIGSLLFGALCNAHNYITGLNTNTQELFKMLPYVVTLVVLIITSMRKKREHQPPAGLGLPHFREER